MPHDLISYTWLCVHNHKESHFDHGVSCNRVTWPTPLCLTGVADGTHMVVPYMWLIWSTIGICGKSNNHYGGTVVTTAASCYHLGSWITISVSFRNEILLQLNMTLVSYCNCNHIISHCNQCIQNMYGMRCIVIIIIQFNHNIFKFNHNLGQPYSHVRGHNVHCVWYKPNYNCGLYLTNGAGHNLIYSHLQKGWQSCGFLLD